jgi:hypothetical protein
MILMEIIIGMQMMISISIFIDVNQQYYKWAKQILVNNNNTKKFNNISIYAYIWIYIYKNKCSGFR